MGLGPPTDFWAFYCVRTKNRILFLENPGTVFFIRTARLKMRLDPYFDPTDVKSMGDIDRTRSI